MGVARVLLAMQACDVQARFEPDAYVVHAGEGAELVAWNVAEALRGHGLSVVLGPGGSFKSQMKKADASGARFALIVGEQEVAANKVTVKPLRGGEQRTVDAGEVLPILR
jgi:histidyl-tRNA synthetase